jgi:hypothetical protein
VSFCRYGDASDVSVYETVVTDRGPAPCALLVCCHNGDHFVDHRDFATKRYEEMIAHLRVHAGAGLKVPEAVVLKLREEQRERGDIVRTDAEAARAAVGKKRRGR